MRRSLFILTAAAPLYLIACASVTKEGDDVATAGSSSSRTISFVDDIKPIFEDRCVMCHNSETLPGRMNFENAKGAFVNDKQGRPYIIPGKPHESRLYTNIIAPEFYDLAMPPVSHRLTKKETEKIRVWIEEGADWPSGAAGNIVATEKVLE